MSGNSSFLPDSVRDKKRFLSSCGSCGYEADEHLARCPKCGTAMRTIRQVRGGGLFLAAGGLALIVISAWTALAMGRIISESNNPNATTKFTGGEVIIVALFAILALVFVIGISALLNGVWWMVFGKVQRILIYITFILAGIVVLIGVIIKFLR